MPAVIFIGLGLNDEKGISLEGLEEARNSDTIFAEFYTNIMPNLNIKHLEELVGKKVTILNRTQLEDENGKQIIEKAQRGKAALLVPGDPMIATTHISLRLVMAKQGIPTRVIHASSVVSAISGATGLQSFKFGKSITLPNQEGPIPSSILETVQQNRSRGLHTLLLLDVKPDNAELTINDAIDRLASKDTESANWLAVGVARLGAPDETVKAEKSKQLGKHTFGRTPHSLVFPGKLHFMEAEALKILGGARDSDLEDNL